MKHESKPYCSLSPYTQTLMRNRNYSRTGNMFIYHTKKDRYCIQCRYYEPGSTIYETFYYYTPKGTGVKLARSVRNALIEGLEKCMFNTKRDLERFSARLDAEMEKYKTPQTKEDQKS